MIPVSHRPAWHQHSFSLPFHTAWRLSSAQHYSLFSSKHNTYPVFLYLPVLFSVSVNTNYIPFSSASPSNKAMCWFLLLLFHKVNKKKRYSIFFYVISQTRPVSRFLLLCIIHHTFSYGFSFSILFLWDTVSSFLFGPILLACVIVMLFCTPSRYHYSLCGTAQHHLPYCTMP